MDTELHLIQLASAVPARRLGNESFGQVGDSPAQKKMFLGTRWRHHVGPRETVVDLFEQAAKKLTDLSEIDGIVTNVSVPDEAFTGCGAALAKRLGLKPRMVLDLHNGGCVAFVIMLDYARGLLRSHGLKRILICTGQTAAGRIFGNEKIRRKPQSAVPGDGASVGLVGSEPHGATLEAIVQRCHPEFAEDMTITYDDGRKYWEPGQEPAYIDFPESKIASIIARGNHLVPEIIRDMQAHTGLRPKDFSALVTNQPNPFFLRNWREVLELPADRHFQTFEKYGNLFQAGIPISLQEAMTDGKIKPGDRVMLAGFSHAGDYSAAATLKF